MKQDTTQDNRKRLIRIAKGGTQFYHIEYSVDVRGNVTIFGGEPLAEHVAHDMFVRRTTETYLHLYDGWKRGGEMVRMEAEAATHVTREQLVQAFLQFRQQHPRDGYGMLHGMAQRWCGAEQDGLQAERSDKAEVERELRRRNRQYNAQLYGDVLPDNFDFLEDYNRRMAAR